MGRIITLFARFGWRAVRFLCGGLLLIFSMNSANAVPSFARQTGQSCVACHVSFPELTPYGRYFKLTGYTIGKQTVPLAMMAEITRTSTRNNTDSTGTAVTQQNDNVVFQDLSLFLAGKATDNLGAFIQWTYNNQNFSDPNDPSDRSGHSGIDNTDIRFVGKTVNPGSAEPDWIYGLTLHNNPTVQDVWNSTPAFGFPFTSSRTAVATPSPVSTLIEGGMAQQVAGVGGYVFWKKTLYGELSAYRTANGVFSVLRAGKNTSDPGITALDGYNPYWRLAFNHEWGPNSIMLGSYGLIAHKFPDGTNPSGPTDRFVDVAIDAQYQYITDPHTFTAQATYIDEKQYWNASFPFGSTTNPSDKLKTFRAKATYYYQRRYGVTLGYFSTTGNTDGTLYGSSINGKPDTNGFILELNYVPIQNVRLMLQYTDYRKFLGGTTYLDSGGNPRNANDNNTLFMNVWFAF